MQKLEEPKQMRNERSSPLLPVTAIVAARNEARNLPRCLESLLDLGEVLVAEDERDAVLPGLGEDRRERFRGQVLKFIDV